MIEEWKIDHRKLPRTSRKNHELIKKKKAVVKEYLENWTEKSLAKIAKEYDLNPSQVTRTLQKEISNLNNEKQEISQIVLKNVKNWTRIIEGFIAKTKDGDLKNMDDFAKFTNALKSQYWLYNAIENYGNSNNQKNIIPVSVNIQYNNITNNNKNGKK